MSKGFVYILANSSFAEIKIGKSLQHPEIRAKELYGTGVPTPYDVVGYVLVENHDALERFVHAELSDFRENPNREFFKCDVSTAVSAIRRLVSEHRLEVELDSFSVSSSTHTSRPQEKQSAWWTRVPRAKSVRSTKCPSCGFNDRREHEYLPANVFYKCRNCAHVYRHNSEGEGF